MDKSITIIDPKYKEWVQELSLRYRKSQIKAAVRVNQEKLLFNWNLGHDIVEMHVEERWGESVVKQLSVDLQNALPGVEGLSRTNIYYCKKFYMLYNQVGAIVQQAVGQLGDDIPTDSKDTDVQQAAGIFQIPWGHHCVIMDRVDGDVDKAMFFVQKTIENGWSRAVLLNWIETDLYDREGKALSNFKSKLPEPLSDLAQEITKDPYNFAFAGIRGSYNEKLLKAALLNNITKFLLELGNGFAYVGREHHLQIGTKDKYIDLLFYHISLRCYVAIEVKIDEFDSADIGQLGTYVVACNHQLKRADENPTIGILICKNKDNVLAQYALEASNQPIAISQYDLEKLYPEKVEGVIPSIGEIEDAISIQENEKSSQKS